MCWLRNEFARVCIIFDMVVTTWLAAVIKMQSGRAYEKACTTFKETMQMKASSFPMDRQELHNAYGPPTEKKSICSVVSSAGSFQFCLIFVVD